MAIAVFAVLTQQMGGCRRDVPKTAQRDLSKPLLHFPDTQTLPGSQREQAAVADWEGDAPKRKEGDLGSLLEMEKGEWGQYDFAFFNQHDSPVEIGLKSTACDCSYVKICTLSASQAEQHRAQQLKSKKWRFLAKPPTDPLEWVELKPKVTRGFVVPAGAAGLIRLGWQARKEADEKLVLGAELWMQPEGNAYYRRVEKIYAGVVVRAPVKFDRSVLDIGLLEPGKSVQREFRCWSATRDTIELVVPKGEEHPCIRIAPPQELSAQERKEISEKNGTRVRCGYRVSVTVWDEKDGKRLDVGPVRQALPLRVLLDGRPAMVKVPVIRGTIPSDVRVSGSIDGVIELGTFAASRGTTKRKFLHAAKGTKLRLLSQDPAFLQVTLKEEPPEGSESKYQVTIHFPAGGLGGNLPEESEIIVEARKPDGQTRRVRIPVTGTALSD